MATTLRLADLYCSAMVTIVKVRRLAAVTVLIAGLSVNGASARKNPSAPSTGTGQLFLPNPVAMLGDQSLRDQKDANYPALAAAYRTVTLEGLDGSGYLRGQWANIISETGDPAFSPTSTYIYDRSDDRFEQVMAYYWVTEAQKYLQSLGFGSRYGAVNAESQDVRINQWGADNSFSWDKKDLLKFGKGGVDDAEDAEVILHEYGHAIHDSQVPGFGTSAEAGAIGEAFGDYFAVAVSSHIAPTADPACVADWDAVEYTVTAPHCLRRVDANLHYPEDVRGEVHADGRIWSRALWDIRLALGPTIADTLIIQAQFSFAPDTSFSAAANATVATASALYGAGAAATVRASFVARGLLTP
jgi:zinc metalloprotease ZmpB